MALRHLKTQSVQIGSSVGEKCGLAKIRSQKVSTLILCGLSDGITPATLFKNDTRFKRDNIEIYLIEGAGHFSWIDQPEIVKIKLREFASRLACF